MTAGAELTAAPMRGVDGHQGSHLHLLDRIPVEQAGRAEVDAIIVPSIRSVPYLAHVVDLAEELDTTLLILCSGRTRAEEIRRKYWYPGSRLVAVDIRPNASQSRVGGGTRLPDCHTTALLAGSVFDRRVDTSVKRNLGLAVGKMMGWRRVIFLDDDIEVGHPDHLLAAAALLDKYDAVGLGNDGFPDNSVVCHAYRAVGEAQESFIGGGALAVPVDRISSFFPDIYNEDWFFLLDEADGGVGRVAVTGVVKQKPFDPYVDPMRARWQEFGDCLAEGLYSLADRGRGVAEADRWFWQRFLDDRRRLITNILDRIPELHGETPRRRDSMIEALRAALGRLACVQPSMCVEYLNLWRQDRKVWRDYLTSLSPSRVRGVEDALARLGYPVDR